MDHVKNAQSCVDCVHTICSTFGGILENQCPHSCDLLDLKFFILIWDMGVSYGLTPHKSEFIYYVKYEIPFRDVTNVNKVVGKWNVSLEFYIYQRFPSIFILYLVSLTRDRCLSVSYSNVPPDAWWILGVYGNCVPMLLKTSAIDTRIMRVEHNLPIIFDFLISGKAKKALASNMRSGLSHTCLNPLDFFHDNDLGNLGHSPQFSTLDVEHFSNFCGACMGAAANENVLDTQKELLKWHWKFGIGMYCIQEMMHECHYEDPDGTMTILPTIIEPRILQLEIVSFHLASCVC